MVLLNPVGARLYRVRITFAATCQVLEIAMTVDMYVLLMKKGCVTVIIEHTNIVIVCRL